MPDLPTLRPATVQDYTDYLVFAAQNLMLGRACRYVRSTVGYQPDLLAQIAAEFTTRVPGDYTAAIVRRHLTVD